MCTIFDLWLFCEFDPLPGTVANLTLNSPRYSSNEVIPCYGDSAEFLFRAMGHRAEFVCMLWASAPSFYALWASAKNFVLRYGPVRRILDRGAE